MAYYIISLEPDGMKSFQKRFTFLDEFISLEVGSLG
jgi:hypothetical protein